MAWIEIVDELEASGRLRELYEGMIDPDCGRVDTILRSTPSTRKGSEPITSCTAR